MGQRSRTTASSIADDWVAGDAGWISDESSFYGDDATRAQLEEAVSRSTPSKSIFWEIQPKLPSVIAWINQHPTTKKPPGSNSKRSTTEAKGKGKSRTYLPHDGDLAYRQSHESAAEFVARLPPSTMSAADLGGTWIWVDNPHVDHSKNTFDKDLLIEAGKKLLDEFSSSETETRRDMQGKTESVISRKLNQQRRELEDALKKEAAQLGCTSGKWMLFPAIEDIDEVWRHVCEGVIAGRLGTSAKVAAEGSERDKTSRIVCVYTKDFGDVIDVRRVLEAMVELGIVDEDDGGRGIYYKCDAYSYWGLESGNDFKLKASMYSSREMLKGPKEDTDSRKKRKR